MTNFKTASKTFTARILRRSRRDYTKQLPDDILYLIFDFCIPHSEPSYLRIGALPPVVKPPRNLRPVCRRWRNVVDGGEGLWSRFFFVYSSNNPKNYFNEERVLTEQLSKSGKAPLTFGIRMDGGDSDKLDHLCRIFSMITQHDARWRKVELSLVLYSSNSVESGQATFQPRFHPERWRLLSDFRLYVEPIAFVPIPDSLPRLPMLTSIRLYTAKFTGALSFLRASPLLTDCVLKFKGIPDFRLSPSTMPFVVGQSLRRLRIDDTCYVWGWPSPAYEPINVLNFMECPCLEALVVGTDSPGTQALQSVVRFLRRSAPPLKQLRLAFPHGQMSMLGDLIIECLSLVPDLSTLTIGPMNGSITAESCLVPKSSLITMIKRRCSYLPSRQPNLRTCSADRRQGGLKSVELLVCNDADHQSRSELPDYDLRLRWQLPRGWDAVKPYVKGGFRLVVLSSVRKLRRRQSWDN